MNCIDPSAHQPPTPTQVKRYLRHGVSLPTLTSGLCRRVMQLLYSCHAISVQLPCSCNLGALHSPYPRVHLPRKQLQFTMHLPCAYHSLQHMSLHVPATYAQIHARTRHVDLAITSYKRTRHVQTPYPHVTPGGRISICNTNYQWVTHVATPLQPLARRQTKHAGR